MGSWPFVQVFLLGSNQAAKFDCLRLSSNAPGQDVDAVSLQPKPDLFFTGSCHRLIR